MVFSMRNKRAATFWRGPVVGSSMMAASSSTVVLYLPTILAMVNTTCQIVLMHSAMRLLYSSAINTVQVTTDESFRH